MDTKPSLRSDLTITSINHLLRKPTLLPTLAVTTMGSPSKHPSEHFSRCVVSLIALFCTLACGASAWTRCSLLPQRSRTSSRSDSTPPWTFHTGHREMAAQYMISSGFSFEDGEQILVSVQKPFGLILEQDAETTRGSIVVTDIDPTQSAAKAGVKVGDVLVAVQNCRQFRQTWRKCWISLRQNALG